jgi:glycosyltransferase involved in cell wall biosynthesis
MPASAGRQLIASSRSIAPEDRLDLVLHAAAQLPSDVSVRIHGDGPLRSQLETLAAAYGIEGQVRFESALDPHTDGTCIYPSRHNASTAPIPPGSAVGGSLILDDQNRLPTLENPGLVGRSEEGAPGTKVVTTMAELVSEVSAPDDPPSPTCADARLLKGHRVAMVTNYPTHYRVPLFNSMARRLSKVGADMRVFFTDAHPRRRMWMRPEALSFEHEILRSLRVPGTSTDVPLALKPRLQRYRPSLILVGGFSPFVAGRAASLASGQGTAVGVWSGEIASRRTAKSPLRRMQRRRLIRRASFGIAYGYRGREYLRLLAPTLPCVYGRNTVPFSRPAGRGTRGDAVEILTVSRAVRGKGLDILIDAARMLADLPVRLTIAGGGPMLASLRRRAEGDDRIRIVGAVESDRVGDLYDAADIFAFPSQFDVFGLVIVEAFATGLAVVASNAPGAVSDLAVPNRNCLLVERHTPEAWAASLRLLIEDAALRRTLGEAARTTVERRWTMDHATDAMIAGLRLGALEVSSGGRPDE